MSLTNNNPSLSQPSRNFIAEAAKAIRLSGSPTKQESAPMDVEDIVDSEDEEEFSVKIDSIFTLNCANSDVELEEEDDAHFNSDGYNGEEIESEPEWKLTQPQRRSGRKRKLEQDSAAMLNNEEDPEDEDASTTNYQIPMWQPKKKRTLKLDPLDPNTENYLKCPRCRKIFSSHRWLLKHKEKVCKVNLHEGVNTTPQKVTYTCSHCPKTFPFISALRRHQEAHVIESSKEKKFKCWGKNCGKSFKRSRTLETHQLLYCHSLKQQDLVEELIQPGECPVCGKFLSSKKSLLVHQVLVCKMEVPQEELDQNNIIFHPCDQCEQRFWKPCDLKRHQKKHDRVNNRYMAEGLKEMGEFILGFEIENN